VLPVARYESAPEFNSGIEEVPLDDRHEFDAFLFQLAMLSLDDSAFHGDPVASASQ
jgi:hypothetical protein